MVGVQTLGALCLSTWGIVSTCIILWVSYIHEIWTDNKHTNYTLGELYEIWIDSEHLNYTSVSHMISGITVCN